MVTMFGWLSAASAWASRVNRAANAASRESASGRILSATKRFSCGCRALNTQPMPPWPMSSSTSNCGNAALTAGSGGGGGRSAPPVGRVGCKAARIRQRGQPGTPSASRVAPQVGQYFGSESRITVA
jgi:hypothetical protein